MKKSYTKPAGTKNIREQGRCILAHGEVTGHCHEVIAEPVVDAAIPAMAYFEEPGTSRRVLMVQTRCEIAHQEHSMVYRTFVSPSGRVEKMTVATGETEIHEFPSQVRQGDVFLDPIAPGQWENVRQREYSPSAIRSVAD